MKIIDDNDGPATGLFNIQTRDVFRDGDGDVLMKTFDGRYVDLATGDAYDEQDMVGPYTLLDVELHIKGAL